MQKLMRLTVAACLWMAPALLQAQGGRQDARTRNNHDRWLDYRGDDSVWMVDRGFFATRYYIGDRRVRRRELTHFLLEQESTQEIMLLWQQKYRGSFWKEGLGTVSGLAGGIMLLGRVTTLAPGSYVLPIALTAAGSVLSYWGRADLVESERLLAEAMQLFNYRVNGGTGRPLWREERIRPGNW